MKKIIFSGLCLSFGFAVASDDCDTGRVHEDLACIEDAYKLSKSRLNATYNKVLSKMDENDVGKLEGSQKAWLNYRNMQCNSLLGVFYLPSQAGGDKLISTYCELQKTDLRIKELEELMD